MTMMRQTLVALCALTIGAGAASAQRMVDEGNAGPASTLVRAAQIQGKTQSDDKQQDIVFRTGLVEGSTGAYEIRYAREYSEQMGENESTLQTMSENHTLRLRTEVASVASDGSAVVEATIGYLSSRVETPDGPTSVVLDMSAPVGDAEELIGLERLIPILKGTTLFIAVDANGNVTGVTGLDAVTAMIASAESQDRLLAMLDPQYLGVTLSKLYNAEGGVEHTGDGAPRDSTTWSTLEEIALGGSGQMLISRSWEPTMNAAEGTIQANGVYALTITPPETPNDAAPVVTVAGHTGTGRLLWRASGGLEYLTSTEELALVAVLGAMEVRSTQTSTTSIRRAPANRR